MADNLQVTTQQLDDIPVLLAQGKKIGIPELLDQQFLSHGNWQGTSFGWTTMVWLSHILSEGDHRLNQVQPWVEKRPHILEINTGQNVRASELSDDRLGIVLVELANAEKWKAFETELNRRTLRVYNLKPKRVRVDSTTASGYWTVTENGLFQHGHSKDHRPDLPQLKVMMSALDPMGMPVATQVVSGERADDKLYIPAIKQVSASLDEHGLLYVGDCKMAALGIRAFIQNSQDYYLCPLSEVQLPGDALEAYLQPVWNGNKTLTIGNKTITWAERRLVTFSFQYAHAAHEGLHKRLKKAITELLELNEHKQGKRQFENVVGMQIDADKILKRHRVVELIKLNILDESTERHIRAYGDRPARTEIEHSLTLLAETDDLAVQETAAAHQGFNGLQATIDDTNSLYLSDDSALDTPHYRAHFYLDPNMLTMTDSNSHDILVGYNRDHTDSIFRVYFYKSSGQYKLRTSVKTDSVTNTYSSQYVISDDWHQVEIEWQAASAPGANNGTLSLWIDTTLAETISGVDNDTLTMGSMNFGLVSGVDASTSGSMYFDQFESYRTSSHQAFHPDNGWMVLAAAWRPMNFAKPGHALFQQPDATSTPTPTPTVTATVTATPTQAATATPTLMPMPSGPVTIDYVYDPLNRLTSATYSSGMTYAYSYDAVGNRKSQTITINATATTTLYEYDVANRLSSVGGVTYTYDDNGNLLSDGTNTYTYDAANRLSSITSGPSFVTSYRYSGLGDRFQETVNGVTTTFTMDLNSGLTQALSDGTYSYLYGLGRIAQTNATSTEYFLGDALGSVRQLADSSGGITLTKSYDPYGVVNASSGMSTSSFGYTSEYQDSYNELVYLRARMYAPGTGRFLTRDTWGGDASRPGSFNAWNYTESNPVRYTDPSGHCIFTGVDTAACIMALAIGIPIIAGVTTATWDALIIQGVETDNPMCTDWQQVFDAGKGGMLGALSSEGNMIASIPLAPTYILAYLVYHKTPAEVNLSMLSAFGLDDDYRVALKNSYFSAGQSGGDAGMTYISLATFFKGLPTLRPSSVSLNIPTFQSGGALGYRIVLTLPGVEVIGGSRELVYIGTAGMLPQVLQLFGRGTGGGGQGHHVLSNKIFRALNTHPTLRGVFNRDDFIVRAAGEPYHSGYQTWHRAYDEQVTSWLESNPNATRAEFTQYLRSIYSSPELRTAFPDALETIR